MKDVSKLALFVAAGMMTAGAQGAEFEVADGTKLTLGGEIHVQYRDTELSNANSKQDFRSDGSMVELGGERDLGNGLTAFVTAELVYDTMGEDDNVSTDDDKTNFGLEGDFGTLKIGGVDNVFEDLITDATDPFEEVTPDGASLTDEKQMVTYYSPDFNGFSYRLQSRITDGEDDTDQSSSELSLVAGAEYSAGNFSLTAAFDDRGSVNAEPAGTAFKSEDGVFGVAAAVQMTDSVELSLRYAQQSNEDGNDRDFTGAALVYDYGQGNIYGAIQDVSPDTGDSLSQYAVGVSYDIANDFMLFAEYANYDQTRDTTLANADATGDTIAVVGLILEY